MRDLDWFGRDIDWLPRAALRVVALVALLLVPTSARAQFSIAPEIGVYVPTQPLLSAAVAGPNPQFAELKQDISLSIGARMAMGFGGRFGIEISGAYMPGSVQVSATGITPQSADANLVTGTGQMWVQLLPTSSPVSLGLSGGVSLTSRGGDAFAGAPSTTEVGGVLGASFGFRLGPVLHMMVTVEDYIYNLDLGVAGLPAGVESPTQHDIHVNFGIGIPILGM